MKGSLFTELRRRKVFRVAAAYSVVSWLALQLADILVDNFEASPWVFKSVLALLVLGFPVAVLLAWAYELRPDGAARKPELPEGEATSARAGRPFFWIVASGAVAAIGLTTLHLVWSAADREPATGTSVAVLPFANLSDGAADRHFADGLSEELLNVLAQAPSLRIIGRTSSFLWKGTDEDPRAIGVRLGVTHILSGSVRRQGDRVRVTAQLQRTDDGTHVWSQNYDRRLVDVFEIQDDIAGNVLHALEIVLDEGQQRRMRNAGIRNVEAFVAYQAGFELYVQAHSARPLVPTLRQANARFDEAIALAPQFSAAHYLKSDLYAHVLALESVTEEARIEALSRLRATLEAAHESAHDPMRRALIEVDRVLFSDDWTDLPAYIENVLDQPGCPDPVWLGAVLFMANSSDLVELYRRQTVCEPLDVTGWNGLSLLTIRAGGPQLALQQVANARGALGRRDRRLSIGEVVALLALGRLDEAEAVVDRLPPDDDYFGVVAEPLVLAARGRTADALRTLDARRESAAEFDAGLALWVYAAAGERHRANALAALMDAWPAGPLLLATVVTNCMCGAPFDLDATPQLRERLREARVRWPPPTHIRYPAMAR